MPGWEEEWVSCLCAMRASRSSCATLGAAGAYSSITGIAVCRGRVYISTCTALLAIAHRSVFNTL